MKIFICLLTIIVATVRFSFSQYTYNTPLYDSIYNTPEANTAKHKVHHAEPLFIDLIRDLGAHKGEKEWNVAGSMDAYDGYNAFETLVEYEWAVIDRLGLELEIPAFFYSRHGSNTDVKVPSNRIESLKAASQWSFLVSEPYATTLALGYLHELKLVDLNRWGKDNIFKGNLFNPFFVAAKRWGRNLHTLIYTGPQIFHEFKGSTSIVYNINTSFHYMPYNSRNFIGVEVNQELDHGHFSTVLRPQLRVQFSENFLIGLVTGIPINNNVKSVSSFLRIIYEPH